MIEISIKTQTLTLLRDKEIILKYPISSAKKGIGQLKNSNCTPLGDHIVRAKIGAGYPMYAIFHARRWSGELWGADYKIASEDLILSPIENMSKRIILNAKLNIKFGTDDAEQLHFIVPKKIIYKDTSSTEISHLIRSDVKSMRKLYEKINYIYFNADPTSIDIEPLEINFVKNQ